MYKDARNQKLVTRDTAEALWDGSQKTIVLSGSWLWSTIEEKSLTKNLNLSEMARKVHIDGKQIAALDTTGVYFITYLANYFATNGINVTAVTLNTKEHALFTQINQKLVDAPNNQDFQIENPSLISSLGSNVMGLVDRGLSLIGFFGQFCIGFCKWLLRPLKLQWAEVFQTIYNAGVSGMWVASLLCFLIGVTLAYEISPQFITYGANVYIVNFLGISLFKEVAPLLTAIIVAGRTGSSITAQIGTMQIQEEIDALKTMGISPIKRIVLPKVLGIMIALPLITAIADIVSMLGGAIVSNATMGVNYSLFLERMQLYVSINNYTCGIIKSVFFALAIGLIGCFCGFRVKGNANSIGSETTHSVVLSIMLIVVLDAIFAIIFKQLGM